MNTELPALEASLTHAIAADPRNLGNYMALADFYRDSNEHRKAELTLQRVIEMDPMHLRAWAALGTSCSRREDWRSAADAFERAGAGTPADPADLVRYGSALLAARDIRAAAALRDKLLEQFPDRWEGPLLAGHLHKIHGNADEAEHAYRRALTANPRQTDALYNLVDLRPPLPSDDLVSQLQALRADPSLSNRDSANVLFALAHIRDKAGQTEEAIALYHEANAAAARALGEIGIVYEPTRMEAETARVAGLFDRTAISRPLPPINLDMRLIFVTGMPRSGTTLVERILASHPSVASGGEMPFMQDCLATLLKSQEGVSVNGTLDPTDDDTHRLLLDLRELYLDRLFERDLENDFVVDKLPANFAAIGLIRILFPDALLVHCVRDPMATCWSLYTAHFGMHLPYNASLQHLAHYYNRIYGVLMRHWRLILHSEIIEADYDRLIADPDAEIRSLVRRCGLSWDDRCLKFHENDEPVFTANMLQVRQPVSSTSAKRWQQYEQHLSLLKDGLEWHSP